MDRGMKTVHAEFNTYQEEPHCLWMEWLKIYSFTNNFSGCFL
jgi:hypothetical protein